MVLCCEFLFLSFIHQFLSLALASGPEFLFPWFFFRRTGGNGVRWPLFKGRLSKCLMHYNEKRHLYSHKALSVSSHVCPSKEAEYLRPLSLTSRFPHTSFFFYPAFTTKHPHNTLIFLPSFLSTLEYPVFHLAARWAVWMCLVSYVTSFLESLPPAHCHCITCQLLNEGLFSLPFCGTNMIP